MSEPLEIVAAVEQLLAPKQQSLKGKRVVITAGPTYEPIDPVRYIANRSSGKQGYAIAEAAAKAGAQVTLISGPVTLADPVGVETIRVESACDMLAAVECALPADIAIMAAAVADWRVAHDSDQKIKKDGSGLPPALGLIENPDILKTVGHLEGKRPKLVVGFAAETNDLIKNARSKLERKGADLIVANDVSPENNVMGGDNNTVRLVSHAGVEDWPKMGKDEVAQKLVAKIAELA